MAHQLKKKYVSEDAELMKEWDWENNIELSPYAITSKSDKKANWICQVCGYQWEASVKNRSLGKGCPECAKEKRKITFNRNKIEKNGSLATVNPKLAKEWHLEKNGEITPKDVTSKSGKKVWWKCEKGHEWEAAINNRSAGKGCPICVGQKVQVGDNDLETVNFELGIQWHPTKNYPLTPQMVTANSRRKVWWKCEYGHEWEAAIYSRNVGFGCPYCSGRFVVQGVTDLVTTHPNIAKEWHPNKNGKVLPSNVSIGNHKKVWWKCEKGHEWEAAIYSRRYSGCPICSSESKTSFPEQSIFYYLQKIVKVYNRYQIKSRTEIDIYIPELSIGIEYDGAYYHNGNESIQREKRKNETLANMGITLIRVKEIDRNKCVENTNNTIFCKQYSNNKELNSMIEQLLVCINKIAFKSYQIDIDVERDRGEIYEQYIQREKENSLLFINSKLALEWHPNKNGELTPLMVTANSNKKVWWQCKKKHEWKAVISSRNKGNGCPYCSGLKVIAGENDLATVNPKLVEEWHWVKNETLNPSNVAPNSNKRVWWQCKKGHEWKATIYSRNSGNGCPFCSNVKVLKGYNDLTTTNPDICVDWDMVKNGNLTPEMFVAGSEKKVWWKCKECGNEWKATINKRTMGRGCPECGKVKRGKSFTLNRIKENGSLASLNPELVKEWHPTKNGDLLPMDVTCKTNKKIWWKCEKGHEWETSVADRSNGNGCPICVNKKLLVGYNDLQTVFPHIAKEWDYEKNSPLIPSEVLYGGAKKAWWKCEKGHEWQAQIYYRTTKQLYCPICKKESYL